MKVYAIVKLDYDFLTVQPNAYKTREEAQQERERLVSESGYTLDGWPDWDFYKDNHYEKMSIENQREAFYYTLGGDIYELELID